MYFDHIHCPQFLSYTSALTLSPYPPSLSFMSPAPQIEFCLYCPTALGSCAFPGVVHLAGGHIIKGKWLSHFHQLSNIKSYSASGRISWQTHQLHAGILSGLGFQKSLACCHDSSDSLCAPALLCMVSLKRAFAVSRGSKQEELKKEKTLGAEKVDLRLLLWKKKLSLGKTTEHPYSNHFHYRAIVAWLLCSKVPVGMVQQ